MKNRKFHPFAALAVLAATTAVASAASGSLDKSFGSSGKATANYGGTDSANAVAIQKDGKFIVVGTTTALGTSDFAILRYKANGSLDTSFDFDGGVITDISNGSADVANGVAIQSDGKILVVGTNGVDTVLVRYHPNGALDTFFGAGGRVILNLGSVDSGNAIAVQSDGKIVIGGAQAIGASGDFTVARFNKNGSLDTSFNSSGSNVFTLGGDDIVKAIAIQPNGSIVLAGYSNAFGTNDFAVARVTSTGANDLTFSGDGEVVTALSGDDQGSSLAIQPDGRILVGGSIIAGNNDFAIVRYDAAGVLDNSFSADGQFVHSFGSVDISRGMALQKDGKIILAGSSTEGGDNDFALARYNADGTQDIGFGINADGELLTEIGSGTVDQANAIALQKDGRIIVVGSSAGDFAAVRYNLLVRTDARIGTNSSATTGNNVYNTSGAGQTLNASITRSGGKNTSFVRVQNDGQDKEAFTIKGTGSNSDFSIRYLNGSSNVTTDVVAGTFTTANLAPGSSFALKVEIVANTSQKDKTRNFSIKAKAVSDTSIADTVVVKAKSK